MIRRNVILKMAEWFLVFFKYLALVMLLAAVLTILFRPEAFSKLSLNLNAHLFSEMDIEVPIRSEALTSNQNEFFGGLLSETKFTVGTLRLQIEGDSRLRRISFFMAVFTIVIFYTIISQLLAMVKSVKIGSPFTIKNVKRIRVIGFLLIGLELLSLVGNEVLKIRLRSLVLFENRLSSVQINLGTEMLDNWLFIGLMILVIAEVFRQGVEMKQEQELTI